MKDQHEKITGYRDLTQGDIDGMNEIKALASQVGELVEKLSKPAVEGPESVDMRWVNIAKTQLQQGFMALTRAIAQPTTF